MSWENWETITSGDIIKKSKLDQIKDNLQYLTSIELKEGDNSGSGVGRCIAYYSTIYATDNGTHCSTDNNTVASNCGLEDKCNARYSSVQSAVGECGTGYLNNTQTNHCESYCNKDC